MKAPKYSIIPKPQKYEVIGSDEQVISGMESGEGDSCTVTLVNGGAAFVLLD